MNEPIFAADNLPSDPEGWSVYRKVALTRATRIDGPFTVSTSEGPLHCEDGYLAIDSRGYPYPIATDEFHAIYAPTDGVEDHSRRDRPVDVTDIHTDPEEIPDDAA